jgi:hypothetical protein
MSIFEIGAKDDVVDEAPEQFPVQRASDDEARNTNAPEDGIADDAETNESTGGNETDDDDDDNDDDDDDDDQEEEEEEEEEDAEDEDAEAGDEAE